MGTFGWTTNLPSQNTWTTNDARIQRLLGITNATTVYDSTNNHQVEAIYTPTGSGRELQAPYIYDARHRLGNVTPRPAGDPVPALHLSGSGHAYASAVAAGSDIYAYDENDNRTRVSESNGRLSIATILKRGSTGLLTLVSPVILCASWTP